MPTVNDVLRQKGQSLLSVDPGTTVLQAVKTMNDNHVGAVVVQDEGELVGIFTERDVLTRIVASEISPHDMPVREVMTTDVICCGIFTDLDDVAQIMQSRRVRHLPIRDVQDRVVGMISIGDVNAFNVLQKQATIENMTDYICGRS